MTYRNGHRNSLPAVLAVFLIGLILLSGCSSPGDITREAAERIGLKTDLPAQAQEVDGGNPGVSGAEKSTASEDMTGGTEKKKPEEKKSGADEKTEQGSTGGTEKESAERKEDGTKEAPAERKEDGTEEAPAERKEDGTEEAPAERKDNGTEEVPGEIKEDGTEVVSGEAEITGAEIQEEEKTAGNSRSSEIVSQETFDRELENTSALYGFRTFQSSFVTWQGKSAAVDDRTGTVYIPCSARDGKADSSESGSSEENPGKKNDYQSWKDIVSYLEPAFRGERILYLEEEKMGQIGDAVREGYNFEALLCSEYGASRFRVVLTGLPVLCIRKTDETEVIDKEDHTGQVSVIDTTGLLLDSDCVFHVRGNYAADLEKKPYKVSLKKKNGKKNKISLLGLRKDDDWILNPLYSDYSRVREMTAYKVWEQVTSLSQTGCPSSGVKYVEVFMDNTYHGVYALTEPVDGKQLREQRMSNQVSFSEQDILYKINSWNSDYPYLEKYASGAGMTEIADDNGKVCVEIRYPKEWEPGTTWDPMYLFQDFVFRTGDLEGLRRAGIEVDTDSVVTLSLFCGLTHATDNTWKNSLLIAERVPGEAENRWMIYRDVWDLNYVFGDTYDGDEDRRYTGFSLDNAGTYTRFRDSTYDYETLKNADPSLAGALDQKWAQWRSSGISADSVCRIAESSYDELVQSGALGREMGRWPQEKSSDQALEEMENWIRNRFVYLDGRFGFEQGAESGQ